MSVVVPNKNKIMMRYLTFLLILVATQLHANGIEFFHGTWEQALEKAKQEEKLIFVDAYAEWCGPCKRMARNVFTQDAVGDFYNKNFINLKIDMEKAENETFRNKYPVAAFPTLYYIDFTGEVVQKIKGAQTVEGFINLGKTALNKNDRSDYYANLYEAGKREYEVVYNHIKALNRADQSSLRIANDYLYAQENLETADNLKFILEATTEIDSRIFDLLIEYRSQIEAVTSKEEVEERIEQAANATLDKAVKYESEDLLEEAQAKMKAHHPSKSTAFELESEMTYARIMQQEQRYFKAWKKYVGKVASDDPQECSMLANTLVSAFPNNTKAIKSAARLAKQAAAESDQYEPRLIYAQILFFQNKKDEAVKVANQALEQATKANDRMGIMEVKNLMQQML